MHKYMHHIGDFMRDTNYLTPLEECFYRRALDFYYLNEKPLPKETQTVMKRLRAITQEERDALILVLNDFFILEDDGFHNKRCDAEISIYQGNAVKNRENGKLGGRPKKNNNLENLEKTQVVILENPNESQSKGNQQPTTNNQQPILKEKKFSFENELISLGGRKDLVSDYVKHRKEKKASMLKTGFNGFKRELDKSGLDVNTIMNICIDKNWRGFESEWLASVNILNYQSQSQEKQVIPEDQVEWVEF